MRRPMTFRRCLTLALTCCAATLARAQNATARRLNPVSATHPAEFSSIAMIRELGDGRVIVLDTTEKRLLVADFRDGTVKPLGRTGDGPEEYRRPNALFPLPNDSTLLTDASARRWILFAGDHPVGTVGGQSPLMAGGGTVRGADVGFISRARLAQVKSPSFLDVAPELVVEVMKRHPKTSRLILSGYADQEQVARCIGATHQFIAKPVGLKVLRNCRIPAIAEPAELPTKMPSCSARRRV